MGKTLLFHNNATPNAAKRYAEYLREPMETVIEQTLLRNTYGNRNTGTYVMTDTLKKIVDADDLIPRFYEFKEHVDTVVTNILHRIGGNLKVDIPYWENILHFADRVVPLSLGFAFENGKIAPLDSSLKRLLEMLADRIELGVRTEYDADFLCKNGIKNVRVIGCPSLYYHMDRNFKIPNPIGNVTSINFNFTTDFGNLGISQKDAVDIHWNLLLYFKWLYERTSLHIDYTMQKPPFAEIHDIHTILLSYGEVHPFYRDCGRYFYSVKDWIAGVKRNNFSIGSRFHGNIAAILAGVPALMINVDRRMEGMNSLYHIPAIDICEFDINKPLEYYLELTDYTQFNQEYAKRYNEFLDYCNKNGVPLKTNVKD